VSQIRAIQLRRGNAEDWSNAEPVLDQGEIGYELDTGRVKIGDGESIWSRLPYLFRSTYAITVSGSDSGTGVMTVSLGTDASVFGVDGPGIPIPHNAQLISWAAAFMSDNTPSGPWTIVVQRKRGDGTFESLGSFSIEVS
jgi:hypothetical protein